MPRPILLTRFDRDILMDPTSDVSIVSQDSSAFPMPFIAIYNSMGHTENYESVECYGIDQDTGFDPA